jgi:hypothetical protein
VYALFSLLALPAAAQLDPGGWGPDVQLTSFPVSCQSAAIVRDSRGVYHQMLRRIISDRPDSDLVLRTSRQILTGWSDPITVRSGEGADNVCFSIALDSRDRMQCIYSDDKQGNFENFYMYSDNLGTTWTTPLRLTNNAGASWNCSVATRGNNVYLLWDSDTSLMPGWVSYNPQLFFRASFDRGKTWQAEKQVIPSERTSSAWSPSIYLDSRGTIHVFYHDSRGGARELFYCYSTNQGDSWSTETAITPDDDTLSELPAVVFDPQERFHLFWLDHRIADNLGIYHCMAADSVYDGVQAWTSATRVCDYTPFTPSQSGIRREYVMVVGAPTAAWYNGLLHLAWSNYRADEDPGGHTTEISWLFWTYSRDNGTSWSAIQCISNVDSNSANISSGIFEDKLSLFWRDNRTGLEQMFAKVLGKPGAWAKAGCLANNARYLAGWTRDYNPNPFRRHAVLPGVVASLTEDINLDGKVELVAVAPPNLIAYDQDGQVLWAVNPVAKWGVLAPTARLLPVVDVADVTGDGRPDIIVSVTASPLNGSADGECALLIYAGDRSHQRTIPTVRARGLYPRNAADIDDDARAEILCALDAAQTTPGLIVYNGENGSLSGRYLAGDVLEPRIVGDINNDGNPEIVCSNPITSAGRTAVNGIDDGHAYAVALSDRLQRRWLARLGAAGGVGLAQMPSGSPPYRVANWCVPGTNGGTSVGLSVHDPATGSCLTSAPLCGSLPGGYLVSADLDGDGQAELVGGVEGRRVARFSFGLAREAESTSTLDLYCLADVNGDHKTEVIGADGDRIVILDGNLRSIWTARAGGPIRNIYATDFGVDGNNDLVVQTATATEIWLHAGKMAADSWVLYDEKR